MLRSVPVSAGSHTIELRYEPATLKIGLAITTATAIAILIVAGVYLLRPRMVRRRLGGLRQAVRTVEVGDRPPPWQIGRRYG